MDNTKGKPTLEINSRKVDGVTVLDLRGRMTMGSDGSGAFRDVMRGLAEQKDFNTVLNMGGISYIDHTGIGELVAAYTAARNSGGDVKLINLTRKTELLLGVTKLNAIFDIQPDESAAVRAFNTKKAGFAAQEEERRTLEPSPGKAFR